jgi:hypothetical protein
VIAATLPDIPPGWALVIVALIGGPVLVWVQSRAAKKAAHDAKVNASEAKRSAERVEASIGPVNGHGTVQDATGAQLAQGEAIIARLDLIDERQRAMEQRQHAMQTSVDSIVEAAGGVGQRLKQHDREIADLKRREG